MTWRATLDIFFEKIISPVFPSFLFSFFKYIKNSNFWLQKNMQRPCLKWIDMLYLLCMVLVKKSEKNGGKQKRPKNGRNDFFKKNNKYSTSSHLRQGLYTFFWSQKFEFLMYLKTCVCLEEKKYNYLTNIINFYMHHNFEL